jgi:glutamate---cysteine ligase / carboxylate-amine ligase
VKLEGMHQTARVRTVGVEEELLLVDIESGRPLSVAQQVLARADPPPSSEQGGPGGTLEAELQQQQVEADTPPSEQLSVLEDDVRSWRQKAIRAAREAGAHAAAVGTSPMPVEPRPFVKPRYREMAERFGLTTLEQLTCGCHVHVSVESLEEAVGVLDRIRVWLPSLLAISGNSPFWQGRDSSYASFRSQAWLRWPSAGPTDVFVSAEAYRRLVGDMLASGVLMDEGMVYFDARASHRYPTVEIRVMDVCLDARDVVLVAGLCRALVDTAAREWRDGQPAPSVPTPMLRLASWQAGRHGLDDTLLDPLTCRPRPAVDVLADLVRHVRPALRSTGDEELLEARLTDVLARGNGARRQREMLQHTGRLVDVVAHAVRVTAGQDA